MFTAKTYLEEQLLWLYMLMGITALKVVYHCIIQLTQLGQWFKLSVPHVTSERSCTQMLVRGYSHET